MRREPYDQLFLQGPLPGQAVELVDDHHVHGFLRHPVKEAGEFALVRPARVHVFHDVGEFPTATLAKLYNARPLVGNGVAVSLSLFGR